MGYDNCEMVQFFASISEGFRIGYNYGKLPLKPANKNLQGSHDDPEVVDEYHGPSQRTHFQGLISAGLELFQRTTRPINGD